MKDHAYHVTNYYVNISGRIRRMAESITVKDKAEMEALRTDLREKYQVDKVYFIYEIL